MDRITLSNMKFFGYHGCEEFEKRNGQAFEADVEIRTDLKPSGLTDCLEDAVDYVEIYRKIKIVMEQERYGLLERVAQRVMERVLEDSRVSGGGCEDPQTVRSLAGHAGLGSGRNRTGTRSMILLGLGSNMGDREENLRQALCLLEEDGKVRIDKISSIYETAPFGVTDQADFLNMAALIQTRLHPEELLEKCLATEHIMGRIRSRHWGPRIIDIDILTYNNVQMDGTRLTLPHPGLVHRSFVLIPLLEIAPELSLADGRTVRGLTAAEGFDRQGILLYKRVGWDSIKKCFV